MTEIELITKVLKDAYAFVKKQEQTQEAGELLITLFKAEILVNNLIKPDVSGSLPKAKCECKQNALPYKAEAYIDRCSRCGNDR